MPDFASNLEGHWLFNEASGTTAADSIGSADATLSSSGWTTGYEGSALYCNGARYATVADTAVLRPTSVITFSVRVYVSSYSGFRFVLQKEGSSVGYGFYCHDANDYHAYIRINGGWVDINSSGVSQDAWHTLTLTYDGTTVRFYVDGVEEVTSTVSGSINHDTADLRFGAGGGGGDIWPGLIDDARVYSRALDATDVAALHAWTGVSVIDGVAAFTEPNEALTGAAAVAVSGVGTFTEPVGTLTGVAAVANTGSATFTEPAEALSSAVEVRWYAAAAFTEPGDALTSAVAVAVVGALNASDPAAEALTSAAALAGVATSAFTEPGESLSSDATVTGGAITATSAFTEANESLTSAALVVVAGTLANAEANEALTGVGAVAVVGSAAFTETGESLSSDAIGSMAVNVAFTEPNETHTGAAQVVAAGSMQATEPNEALTSAVAASIAGAGAFTEANEAHTGAGLVVIIGTASFTEPNEQLGSLVDTGTGFVYGTHRRISVGVGIGI